MFTLPFRNPFEGTDGVNQGQLWRDLLEIEQGIQDAGGGGGISGGLLGLGGGPVIIPGGSPVTIDLTYPGGTIAVGNALPVNLDISSGIITMTEAGVYGVTWQMGGNWNGTPGSSDEITIACSGRYAGAFGVAGYNVYPYIGGTAIATGLQTSGAGLFYSSGGSQITLAVTNQGPTDFQAVSWELWIFKLA